MMRRLICWLSLAPLALHAQAGKSAPAKASPITAGGSSTARAATPAPSPTVTPAGKAPPSVAAPAAVAAKSGAAPAAKAGAVPAAKAGAVPAAPSSKVAVAAAGTAATAATAATAGKPSGVAAPAPVATPAEPAVVKGAAPASAQVATGVSITIDRELFTYERGARRDPYSSLLQSEELKPAMSDLKLIGVVLDPRGRNSIAVMRDLSTKELYRVRPGQSVGRLRVTQISQRSVTFQVEEFGVTRQEILSLKDANTARTP